MELILTQDVDKIGKAGSVVKVKDGYARNFLIPNKLAVAATKVNLTRLEAEKKIKNLQMEKAKKDAEELKSKLAGLSLTVSMLVKEDDKIFGSIGAQEIIAALKDEGYQIEKEAILLPEPLKALGIYEVPVRLHPEVSVNIKVWIVKK